MVHGKKNDHYSNNRQEEIRKYKQEKDRKTHGEARSFHFLKIQSPQDPDHGSTKMANPDTID